MKGNYPLLHVLAVNYSAFLNCELSPTELSFLHAALLKGACETQEQKQENGNYDETKMQNTRISVSNRRRQNESETKRSVPLHGNGTLMFLGPYCICTSNVIQCQGADPQSS